MCKHWINSKVVKSAVFRAFMVVVIDEVLNVVVGSDIFYILEW